MKDSGGIHNTTLKIGPPAQFIHAGRYICLVNNPEGHAHKEIFVQVLTDSQFQRQMSGKDIFLSGFPPSIMKHLINHLKSTGLFSDFGTDFRD